MPFTVTTPHIDDLFAARSRHSVPYMHPNMSPEDNKEYILSFVNDKRISTQTRFNLFQTALNMFNAGGGFLGLNSWDCPDCQQEDMPKVFMEAIDFVCFKSMEIVLAYML